MLDIILKRYLLLWLNFLNNRCLIQSFCFRSVASYSANSVSASSSSLSESVFRLLRRLALLTLTLTLAPHLPLSVFFFQLHRLGPITPSLKTQRCVLHGQDVGIPMEHWQCFKQWSSGVKGDEWTLFKFHFLLLCPQWLTQASVFLCHCNTNHHCKHLPLRSACLFCHFGD